MRDWRPTCTIDTLQRRAGLINDIRRFFQERGVLEVETPVMSPHGVTDVFIDSIKTQAMTKTHYLQTSPEYAMKRLLAAGSGDIFQLCKSFRNDEQGRLHQPEFTLLEWYRTNWTHHQLMDEVDQLLQTVLQTPPAIRLSYRELYLQHFNIDPHILTVDDLKSIAAEHQLLDALGEHHNDTDDWLMLLLSHLIEPKLGYDRPYFIYDYPKTQAALSRINNDVAERFEVYMNGIELANGFHELQDAKEQLDRFEQDNQRRALLGKPAIPIDTRFINALLHGLPQCSGVAIGIDRLIMIALDKTSIAEVTCF